MSMFRKALDRAVSMVRTEPTDNPIFGAFVDGSLISAIRETEPYEWARPSGADREPTKENYPGAWRAGRDLARSDMASG